MPHAAVARSPFDAIAGRIVSGTPLFVLPGAGWRASDGRWQIGDEAAIVCHVDKAVDRAMFELSSDAKLPALELFWDGSELPPSMSFRTESSLRVEIPPSMLTRGTHELTLRLTDAPDGASFTTLAFRSGTQSASFSPADHRNQSYLASLLTRGVTGIDSYEQLGGFAFVGHQKLAVAAGATGAFTTTVENGSFEHGFFVITGGETTLTVNVPPLQRRAMTLVVPAGLGSIELATYGSPSGLYLWGAPAFRPERKDSRPLIVLVTLDTTRKDVLGPYGGSKLLTPNLTRFARHATVYENAWSTSPWTIPSHASIFTGLYPSRHGAGVGSGRLTPSHNTLAELLADSGYDTAGFPGGALCGVASGLAQGFLTYREPERGDVPDATLTNLAVAKLDAAGTAPLFLFVNYFGPHFPYLASPRAMKASGADVAREAKGRTPRLDALLDGDGETLGFLVDRSIRPSEADVRAIRLAYEAGVSDTDAELGRLLEALDQRGLYDDALIVVTADHGELLGEGGHFTHTTRLDDELVAVPFIVKWPGQEGGRRVDELVSLVDLFPTILGAAGLPAPTCDGIDLNGPSAGAALSERIAVLAEEHDRPGHRLFASMKLDDDLVRVQARDGFMLQTSKGKTCHERRRNRPREIDCGTDGAFSLPLLPAAVLESMGKARKGSPKLDDEQLKNLRALGYIR